MWGRGGGHHFELYLEKQTVTLLSESGKGIPDRRKSICKIMRARNSLEYSDERGNSMQVESRGIISRE